MLTIYIPGLEFKRRVVRAVDSIPIPEGTFGITAAGLALVVDQVFLQILAEIEASVSQAKPTSFDCDLYWADKRVSKRKEMLTHEYYPCHLTFANDTDEVIFRMGIDSKYLTQPRKYNMSVPITSMCRLRKMAPSAVPSAIATPNKSLKSK